MTKHEREKPTTIVSTIPGSGYTKFIRVALDETHACRDCGEYPTKLSIGYGGCGNLT
jgi:hypothetical protein